MKSPVGSSPGNEKKGVIVFLNIKAGAYRYENPPSNGQTRTKKNKLLQTVLSSTQNQERCVKIKYLATFIPYSSILRTPALLMATVQAELMDPLKIAKYPVHLGHSLANPGVNSKVFSSVKCKYSPKLLLRLA